MESRFNLFRLDKVKIFYFSILFLEKIFLTLFHIYFINYFDRDLYGLFNQLNFLSGFLVNLSFLGTLVPIVIFSKQKKNFDYDSILNAIQFIFIVIVILIGIIILIFNQYFTNYFFGDNNYVNYIFLLMLITVLDLFSEIFIQKTRIEDNLLKYSKFILLRTTIRLLVLVIVYKVTGSFFISILVSIVSYFLLVAQKVKISLPSALPFYKKNFSIIKGFLKQGFYFLLIYIFTAGNLLIINTILASKFKLESLAIYNFNNTFASFPLTFTSYIIFYSLPQFADSNRNNHKKIKKYLKDIFFALSILLFSYLVLRIFYEDIIKLISNDSNYQNLYLFDLISIANILIMINSFIQFPLLNEHKYGKITLIQFIGVLFTVCSLLISETLYIETPIYFVLISNFLMLILYLIFSTLYAKN